MKPHQHHQQQAEILVERKLLSVTQLKTLRAYVLKRRREQEEHANTDECTAEHKADCNNTSDCSDNKNVHNESCDSHVKGKDENIEDVTEQLQVLKEKLEKLRKEKHQLFQELKKVLHEEDEKRQQQQLEQQKLFQATDQESVSSYHQTEGPVSYRNDPRLGKASMQHHPWSSNYGYREGSPPNKIPRTMHMQLHTQSQYMTSPYAINEQDKYATPPYMQQRMPPQGHVIRPHSMSSGYHQYRVAGGPYGGYNPGNQYQYQNVPAPGGYIQSPGPLHPDVIPSQIYHQQQQYIPSQGMPPVEYPSSHFTFEPHQPSRYITMRGGRGPPLKAGGHFSPQHEQTLSPSHSPALPTNDRMRYVQQQRTKK